MSATRIVELTESDFRLLAKSGIRIIRTWTTPQTKRNPVQRGVQLQHYRSILIDTLQKMGGGAPAHVGSPLYRRLEKQLAKTSADRQILSSGHERWWNSIAWERKKAVEAGELRADSPKGRWELVATMCRR